MLKETITYEDFNGNQITEDFYFNLTKAEVIEMEFSENESLSKKLNDIIESLDRKQIIETFKEIILSSYGVKSEDGKRFIKNDELREAFAQSNAFSELFTKLSTEADAAAAFVTAVIPSMPAITETKQPQ